MHHTYLAVFEAMMSFCALWAYHTIEYHIGEILHDAVNIETSAGQ
jgi:hypothetical protein